MQNRRKKIVINQKFQYQYAVIIVALTVLLANSFIILRSLIPSEQALELSANVAWAIGIFEIILVVGVWYGSLKATHRIAGPIYIFARQIKAVGAGDLWARISLRDGDMFQQEAAVINASLDQLQSKVEAVQDAARLLQEAQGEEGAVRAGINTLMSAVGALRTARED
jgi:methyl-accepting chemotaxis protein